MVMNGFRICADITHLLAFLLLISKIFINRSCAGISGKSQLLITMVFTFRYLDLLAYYISFYNTLFKLVYIALAYLTIYLIFINFRKTYDSKNDSFWATLIILFACVLTCCVNYISLSNTGYQDMEIYKAYLNNPLELTWTFSIYLEALAIIPQLHMIRKTGDGQNVLYYILLLTVYRGLYMCNWIYRYFDENHLDVISSVSGTVQTLLLIITVVYIQLCKENKPKWQEITEVFTIEAAKVGESKKSPSFCITQSQKEDTNHLIPQKN